MTDVTPCESPDGDCVFRDWDDADEGNALVLDATQSRHSHVPGRGGMMDDHDHEVDMGLFVTRTYRPSHSAFPHTDVAGSNLASWLQPSA